MPTYLDGIVAWHRARADADERDLEWLAGQARTARQNDPVRPFEAAIRDSDGVALIAEIKRRSPSRGDLDRFLDAAATARQYEEGGAACLSVLTDAPHFAGSPEDLVAARRAVLLPVLRKDFTVTTADIYDAAIMGADAVLLIVAVLSDDELARFIAAASSFGMDALVEVHDEHEAERAVGAGASLVGVNQRDLHTFEVDPERAVRVSAALPPGVVRVAESGIREAAEIARLSTAGYDAVLIGETLVRAPNRAEALRALSAAGGSVARSCG
ncbi:MAG: indole-3-glycerol phosphate synthase TrpC [Acidimicrobiales bacterium]|jgi:indole-3-glycerol phosphate synthase